MKALVLVAHPDDELLFAGALMLSRPQWDWTLVALTGGERKDRFPGLSLGFRDEWRILTVGEFRDWKAAVAGLELRPDAVFTHNLLGEYGHPHHMAVHRIAHEVFDSSRVWDFHSHAPSSVGDQALRIAATEISVTPEKVGHFIEVYGEEVTGTLTEHQPELVRQMFVTGPECFTGSRLVPA